MAPENARSPEAPEVHCQIVGEPVTRNWCWREQGAPECRGCPGPYRRCTRCRSCQGLKDLERGLCETCLEEAKSLAPTLVEKTPLVEVLNTIHGIGTVKDGRILQTLKPANRKKWKWVPEPVPEPVFVPILVSPAPASVLETIPKEANLRKPEAELEPPPQFPEALSSEQLASLTIFLEEDDEAEKSALEPLEAPAETASPRVLAPALETAAEVLNPAENTLETFGREVAPEKAPAEASVEIQTLAVEFKPEPPGGAPEESKMTDRISRYQRAQFFYGNLPGIGLAEKSFPWSPALLKESGLTAEGSFFAFVRWLEEVRLLKRVQKDGETRCCWLKDPNPVGTTGGPSHFPPPPPASKSPADDPWRQVLGELPPICDELQQEVEVFRTSIAVATLLRVLRTKDDRKRCLDLVLRHLEKMEEPISSPES
ncbi:MAG: hypothetical protein V1821_04305 [bacterium]